MKTLSNIIEIIPLDEFQSFDGTHLVSSSDTAADIFPSLNTPAFDEKPKTGEAGTIYPQTFTIITDGKLTDAQKQRYPARRPVVAVIKTDDGVSHLLGDTGQKLRISVTPALDYDQLDFNRNALSPLF